MKILKMAEAPFMEAVSCLPTKFRDGIDKLSNQIKATAEEVRMRAGRELSISIAGREIPLLELKVTETDLGDVVSRAAHESVHAYSESLRQGFLTMPGGHRIGICGTAVVQNDHFSGIRNFSSINIRIARPVVGCAHEVFDSCCRDRPTSIVLLSPPGFGKTTLLRDLIRCLSQSGVRVAVADERGEIAALHAGVPQFELGPQADVLEFCAKHEAALCLLKTMSPQVLALDEITSPEDTAALITAANCGVSLLATAHASDFEEFRNRHSYKPLIEQAVFDYVVSIDRTKEGRRIFNITKMEGE